jgi:thymidylate kinase
VLLAVTPRPEIIFLLDAPAEVAFDRKKEASLEFYQEQREIYRKILNNKGLNCIVINTAEDYLKTSKRIFGLIESIK